MQLDRAPTGTVIGVDEVGRGALAGPVVVAAARFDCARLPPDLLAALDDSKRLGARRRRDIAERLRPHVEVAFAAASARRIDAINIRAATLDAMRRAVGRLGGTELVLIDGNDLPPLAREAVAIVGGDATVPQIAAASILAKILRDDLMARLGRRWPAYGHDAHAGYGTERHREALRAHGPSPHHRLSFLTTILGKSKTTNDTRISRNRQADNKYSATFI